MIYSMYTWRGSCNHPIIVNVGLKKKTVSWQMRTIILVFEILFESVWYLNDIKKYKSYRSVWTVCYVL